MIGLSKDTSRPLFILLFIFNFPTLVNALKKFYLPKNKGVGS